MQQRSASTAYHLLQHGAVGPVVVSHNLGAVLLVTLRLITCNLFSSLAGC